LISYRFDGLRFGKRCEITSDSNTNSFEYEAVNHLCKAVENHRNLYFGSEVYSLHTRNIVMVNYYEIYDRQKEEYLWDLKEK
jgi:hypothetical protein